MSLKLWLGENDVETFYDALKITVDDLPLEVYEHSFTHDGDVTRILTGELEEPGLLDRIRADEFELSDCMWVPTKYASGKSTGHFVVAKRTPLSARRGEEGRYAEGSGGEIFQMENFPGPLGPAYMTTHHRLNDTTFRRSVANSEKPPSTFGQHHHKQTLKKSQRVELTHTGTYDRIQEAFVTYYGNNSLRFDPGKNRPPLLVYQK